MVTRRVVRVLGPSVELIDTDGDAFIGLSAGLVVRRSAPKAGPRVHGWNYHSLLAEVFARKHAELVDVYCVDGEALLVEAVFGKELASIVAACAMPPKLVRAVGAAIARSMAATHAFHHERRARSASDTFVYGDLSLDDVMIAFDGRVRVTRVEAVWARDGRPISVFDAVTDARRAPFIAPAGMSMRGDLYSLGTILARLLAAGGGGGGGGELDALVATLRDMGKPMVAVDAVARLSEGAADAAALAAWLREMFPNDAAVADVEVVRAARQVLPEGGRALVDGSFDEELARAIVAKWGPKAPASAVTAAPGAESFTIKRIGSLTWLQARWSHTGMNWAHLVPVAGVFQRVEPAAAIGALLADAMPDLTACVDDVLSAYETFGPAKVFRSLDDIAELSKDRHGGGDKDGADPQVLAVCEPPHFEGRALVFCANLGWKAELVRVRVDAETYAVQSELLGRGQRWMVPMGRAYVDDAGVPVMPARAALVRVDDVPRSDNVPRVPRDDVTTTVAQMWRDNAALELVSVASFARASLELLAVAAPLSLVERTHRAALDEIEHARASYDVATRLDGRVVDGRVVDGRGVDGSGVDGGVGAVAALAPRAASVERVAVDTLVEAAIPETIAAALAAAAAAVCVDDHVRSVVARIAAEEARHAALAWDVVDWACAHDNDARSACAREQRGAFARAIAAVACSDAAPLSGFGLLTSSERDAALEAIRRRGPRGR